ncbi:MAG: hypothetical protein QG622_15 [Actinomycetota bacterium]|nr:hypothetical protein [Actinomycetota bacterium]
MAMASINIPAMAKLIAGMDSAASDLPRRRTALANILSGAGVDPSPADGLTRVVTWITTETPGLRRRHALAVYIEAQTPGLTTTVRIDESTLPTDPPEVAARRGRDAAKALKDSDGKPDDALLAQLEAGMTDPYFAEGFAKEASPEDLAAVALSASRQRDTLGLGGSPTAADYENWSTRYERMLTAVGTTIGTATGNTGDAALPSDYAKRWADAITEEPAWDGGRGVPGAGAAAALFLRYGTYSTSFLNTVSTTVYDYEQAHKNNGPLWSRRSQENATYFGVYAPDGTRAYDPLASLMVSLGHNAAASQNFFSGGGTSKTKIGGQDVQVNSRLKYLLYDRIWPTDDGDGLGLALESATTHLRDTGSTGQASAKIASQTIALLGNRIGKGDSGWNPLDESYQIPTGMTDSVARMVASYMPDVYRVANSQSGDGKVGANGLWTISGVMEGYPADLPTGARFSKADLALVLQGLGRSDDKTAISTVTAAGLQFQVDLTDSALTTIRAAHPGTPLTMDDLRGSLGAPLNNAGVSSATALNYLVVNGFQGGKAEQEIDKADRERLGQIFDMATTFVPSPQGKIAAFLVEQGTSVVGDQITAESKDRATEWANQTHASIITSLEYQTYNALLRNGFIAPGTSGGLPASAIETGADGRSQIKPYLYDSNGVNSADFDQATWDEFVNWHGSLGGAPRDQTQPWFLAPFNDNFTPNFG